MNGCMWQVGRDSVSCDCIGKQSCRATNKKRGVSETVDEKSCQEWMAFCSMQSVASPVHAKQQATAIGVASSGCSWAMVLSAPNSIGAAEGAKRRCGRRKMALQKARNGAAHCSRLESC